MAEKPHTAAINFLPLALSASSSIGREGWIPDEFWVSMGLERECRSVPWGELFRTGSFL